jgi:cation diffusion facilitator CzcD-associated flavoprotein CzcO
MGSRIDAVVVGAGFAGLYMLKKLRDQGADVRAFEAGSGVGGTWYWNRYPGARCDVESIEYSYGFDEELQQEWTWTERFATQPEILRYLEHVADRFGLRDGITFDARVESATWDDESAAWTVTTSTGEVVEATHLVMATGCLSSANLPHFEGLESFEGRVLHTGQWPHDGVDLEGARVAVIGTGSSAIQSIPVIAQQASSVTVFQRTAAYSVPARNRPYDPAELDAAKADYPSLRQRQRESAAGFGANVAPPTAGVADVSPDEAIEVFERKWDEGGLTFLGAFNDMIINPTSNEAAAEFVREKIRGIVHDPEVAELLAPKQVIGCKRLCVDTGYYETFNRENVHLVDISDSPIERITPGGIVARGEEHEVDVIVFATGFDAMTGALLRVDVKGRDGVSLRDAWAEGPKTYLGLQTPGFPNLFMITGPGSPSVLTNMVVSIEHHVEWIARCIADLDAGGNRTIEALPESADMWVGYVNSVADLTLFPSCSSWYLGANIPGKPRVFMPLPGFGPYAMQCDAIAADGYTGFALT